MCHVAGKRFVLSGRFTGTSREALRRRIESAGGLVRARLSPRVDYVVVGAGAQATAERARQLGVAPLEVPELDDVLEQIFPLGLADGDQHGLDLRTGRVLRRLAPHLMSAPRLERTEVDADAIETILRSSGVGTASYGEGKVLAKLLGDEAIIQIEPHRASIRFIKSLDLNTHAADEVKQAIANQLNSEWNLARFYVPTPDTLLVDYSLPYDTGLAPAQLVLTLQEFVNVASTAIATCEDAGLII